MNRRTSLILSLAAAAPALVGLLQGSTQAQAQDEGFDPRVRPPLTQYREKRAAEIEESLEGAWRMTRFIHVEEPLTGTRVDGMTIFREGYGSTIVHAANWNAAFQGYEDFFQATAFHYQIDESLRLQTATIVGHSLLDDVLNVESALVPREFNVEVLGNTLILTRPDGTRLQYERMNDDVFPEKTRLLIQQQRGRSVQPVGGQ